MGVIRAMDGFECETVMSRDGPALHMWDIQKARSGHGYLKYRRQVAGLYQADTQHANAMGLSGADAVQAGQRGRCVMRTFLRPDTQLPSVGCPLWTIGFTNPALDHAGINFYATGKISAYITLGGTFSESAHSTLALTPVAGDTFDWWAKLVVTVDVDNSTTPTTFTVTCAITSPTGTLEIVNHTAQANIGVTIQMVSVRLMPGFGQSGTCDHDVDDYVCLNATNADYTLAALPAEDRIALFSPTGQGADAGWTYDWWRAIKAISNTVSEDHQLAATVGLRTTFLHETAASRGLTSIGGVQVSAIMDSNPGGTTKFRLDGVTQNGYGSTVTNIIPTRQPYYCDISPRTLAAFDATEVGVESNQTASRLFGCNLLVLYSGSAHSPAERSTGGYRHTWIEWTGDGSAARRQVVTGVGFRAHAIMVHNLTSADGPILKLLDAPANMAWSPSGMVATQEILSIDAHGFTVGPDLNVSGKHYTALCVRDDGDSADGRIFVCGSTSRTEASVGAVEKFGYGTAFKPDLLLAMVTNGSAATGMKTDAMGALTVWLDFQPASAFADGIVSLDANGFTLGNGPFASLFSQSKPWIYAGWRISANMVKRLAVGEIPPSAPDVMVTLPAGFQPYFVWTSGNTDSNASKRADEAEFTGTTSYDWNSGNIGAVGIKALDGPGGTFTVAGGTSSGRNLTAAAECWWTAWHREALIGPAVEVTIPETEGPVGLTWVELTDSGSNLNVWSTVALPDPPTYYGGYKDARVTKFGTIRRALSDDLGEYEGIDFSFTLDDSDRVLRAKLDDVATRYFPNRAVVVRTITDELRRLQQIPRTIMRGLVRLYRPAKNLLFDFTVQDSLAALFSTQGDTGQIPKRRITIGNFPNVPQAAASGAGATVKTFTTPHASIPIPPCLGYVQISDQAQIINMTGTVSNGTYGLCDARGWIIYDSVGAFIPEGWVGHAPPVPGDVTWASPDVATALEAAAGGGTTDLVSLALSVPIIYGAITDKNITGGVDAGDGQCPGLYVGAYTLSDGRQYHKWVIAGHACKSIDGIYGSSGDQGVGTSPASQIGDLAVIAGVGGDWVVPGYGAWTTLKGSALYEDINGERFTVVYGRVGNLAADIGAGFFPPLTDASVPLAFSVQGIETIGDGTGTLITELLPQYLHCLQNWVLGDYRTGAWLSSPAFSDDPTLLMIDEASFEAANLVSKRRITGGYRGDFIIGSSVPGQSVVDNLSAGDRVSVRELVARFNVSADVNSGFNRKGQFMVSMVDDADFNVASVMDLNDQSHVHRDTFDVFDDQAHHWNVVPFRHTRDYFRREPDGWRSVQTGTSEVQDDFSINHYGPVGTPLRIVAPTLFLHMLRGKNRSTDAADYAQGSATAADVVGRFLMRHKDPPRLASFQVGMIGHNTDLGDVVRLTHFAGIGSGGWAGRPLRVMRHEASPGEYTVDLTLFDLQAIFATGFILGDETALPALWPAASSAERFYGYLGDELTGLFSTGQPMKRVR